mgnify:CR=1 FL=1
MLVGHVQPCAGCTGRYLTVLCTKHTPSHLEILLGGDEGSVGVMPVTGMLHLQHFHM